MAARNHNSRKPDPFSRRLAQGMAVLLAAGLLSACGKQNVAYDNFQSLPLRGWRPADTLHFKVEIADSAQAYRCLVGIRNRSDYRYQNLILRVACTDEQRQTFLASPDTLDITLTDRQGNWQGNGWGGLYQQDYVAGVVRINRPGTYVISVNHLLADTLLTGINDIGIKLEKLDGNRP